MTTPHPRSLREKALALVEATWFTRFILALILFNAIILGLETSTTLMSQWGEVLLALDKACLAIFVLEILLRLYVWRARFFRDPWSIFDFTVVAIALVPASGPLAILRAFRVLRILRVMTIVPSMRRVVAALLGALPGLGAIGMLLLLIYYVFAVIATDLFGDRFPDWFGSIGASLYTLFQVMTLESWSMGISRPVMQHYPYAWVFFVPFILIATFTILNLFIAIIVNAMQTFAEQDHAVEQAKEQEAADLREQHLLEQLRVIQDEIRSLRAQIESRITK